MEATHQPTERQRAIVSLIAEGFYSYEWIAEELDISRNLVRQEVRVLCAVYDCPMMLLPAALEQAT